MDWKESSTISHTLTCLMLPGLPRKRVKFYMDFFKIHEWFIFSNFLSESEYIPSLNFPWLIRIFFSNCSSIFLVMYQEECINIWTKFGKNSQIVWQTWLNRLQLFWNEFRPMKFTFWHFKWYIPWDVGISLNIDV